ncbi:MAG: hypothetical protein HQK49_19415 [Oligoflexia bacterium]|nr:hypothetical protein [Oligoflexia bacterium]
MAHAYTPGLRVAKKAIIRKKRILPLKGNVLKKVGDSVKRSDVVAKTDLPGNVLTINVVNRLGIMPNEITQYMLKKVGDTFQKDEVLAESKSFIKWLRTKITAPITGSIETISPVTGQVLLREPPQPVEVDAYLNGKVVEVIPTEGIVVETVATFIQGIFGIGGETWGTLKFAVDSANEVLKMDKITSEFKDKVIVAGSFASFETIKKAISVGAKGLIVGGIRDGDLREILGYDLGVAITGTEKMGITLVLTEGFGEIAMADRTFNALKFREGSIASISGATQIRAGVIRPEIIIPYEDSSHESLSSEGGEAQSVKIGDSIRVIRQPYFGKIGIVKSLPHELQKIESETKARVLEVTFPDGKTEVIPRANIELIQE